MGGYLAWPAAPGLRGPIHIVCGSKRIARRSTRAGRGLFARAHAPVARAGNEPERIGPQGVSTRSTPTARPVFHRLPPPTDADIVALLTRLHHRARRLLARRDRRPEAAQTPDPFAAREPRQATAVAAARQGRVALGPRAGQPLRRLRSAAAAAP